MSRRSLWLAAAGVVLVVVVALVAVRLLPADDDAPLPGPGPSPSASSSATASASAATEGAPLLTDPPAAAEDLAADTSLGVPIRSRYVSFDSSVLPQSPDGRLLAFDLFPDVTYTGIVDHVDTQSMLTSWSGSLDAPRSTFVVTLAGDRYQLTASTPQGVFSMSLTRSGYYQLSEIDPPGVIDSGGATPAP